MTSERYCDKGVLDPALEGSWDKVGLAGQDPRDIPGPDEWKFTKNEWKLRQHDSPAAGRLRFFELGQYAVGRNLVRPESRF